MQFDRVQQEPNGSAVRVFKLLNSEATLPMPAGKDAPDGTTSLEWDGDSSEVTYKDASGGVLSSFVLTEEDKQA